MTAAAKRLILNLFEMNTPTHISHGLWRLPGNNRHRYTELGYWTELARILEDGGFDAVFLADVIGAYDVYRDSFDDALREGLQIPSNDPLLVVPAMAAVTERLGFGVTFSTSYEPPFAFARRISTLDHLTAGRIGWNIVTSYLPNAARNFGLADEIPHDDRFARAEEFLDVVYKLWEGSWDDGAVQRDADRGVYADPSKVRRIDHAGEHYRVAGPHLSEPSAQRTPVLFQATASRAGIAQAGKHAEVVFTGATGGRVRELVREFRRSAVENGRAPGDIKVLTQAAVFVGRTEDEAREKYRTYRAYRSEIGRFIHSSSPFDPTRHDPAVLVADALRAEGKDPEEFAGRLPLDLTVARYDEATDSAWADPFLAIGTPVQVADEIERWLDEDDLDGINLRQYHSFDTALDFAELVVPELRLRGRLPEPSAEHRTLREQLFGAGPHLPATHPARRYRGGAALAEAD